MKRHFFNLVIILIIFLIVPTQSICFSFADVTSGVNSFLGAADGEKVPIAQNQISGSIRRMAGIAIAIGTIIMVIVGALLGIKFMSDSTQQKVEVKESLLPFVIGVAIIVGGFTIWSMFVNFAPTD